MPRETHVVVYSRNQDSPDHEKPVEHWHIQLPMKCFRCMDHLNLWKVAEFLRFSVSTHLDHDSRLVPSSFEYPQ